MRRIFSLVSISIVLFGFKSNAQEVASIAEGQALFIYNFTKFVAWPIERKTSEFVIGILGSSDTFQAVKNYTQQKRVAGQDIVVKRFQNVDDVDRSCHILMVTSSHIKDLERIAERAQNECLLLVSEKGGSIEKGAAINFLIVDGKIKYEIKSSNITKCQLKHALQLETLAYKKY